MKFLNLLPGQKLILCRVEAPRFPTSPVVAKSASPRDPLYLIFILWILATLGRPVARKIRNTRPPAGPADLALLIVLAATIWHVFLEHQASNYLQKIMVGA